jgi:hypothetical protein
LKYSATTLIANTHATLNHIANTQNVTFHNRSEFHFPFLETLRK